MDILTWRKIVFGYYGRYYGTVYTVPCQGNHFALLQDKCPDGTKRPDTTTDVGENLWGKSYREVNFTLTGRERFPDASSESSHLTSLGVRQAKKGSGPG
jgi:hypothetical protein